jgi:putative DNA primase/helicase
MTISFAELLAGLDARPSGNQHAACCPAHEDRHPSLSLTRRNGRLLLYCHRGCDFWAIADALERRGLWPVASDQPAAPIDSPDEAAKVARLYARLRRINAETRPFDNTCVDRYLTQRGLTVRPPPQQLGYHPSLFHGWSRSTWPAMVAVVRDVEDRVVGFHRTWLTHTEPVTKAPIDPPRAMLGPLSGHAVHLAPAGPVLLLGEGIETTLSAMQLSSLPAAWAALTSTNLPTIKLPPVVRKVILLVDDDEAGAVGAARAAMRFRRKGLQVEGIKPKGCNDFNDLLQEGSHA